MSSGINSEIDTSYLYCTQRNLYVLYSFIADGPISEFTPCPTCPAVQYLESVDQSGPAWAAGLRPGDFIIEVCSIPTRSMNS